MRNIELSKKIIATLLTGTIALYTVPVLAASKDEVVYSKINGNNEDYSTIVSDKIVNDQRQEYVNDLSSLLNIVNTSGDETFTQDGNKIVWNANGNSLSYQGETKQELPIKTTVSYKLNDEEVTANDLKGKTGKVSITVNYENTDEHYVEINGKTEKMYTPFIVVAGLLVNKDNNENITVTKGKVVDNGKNAIAIGMALPGLQESLDISKSDVDIPSSITFEMDAKDFEMNNIISYVTPKLVEETDIDVFDDMNEIFDKANELQDASNKLVDGTTQLRDGIVTLNNGTHELSDNLNSAINKYESARIQLANKEKIEKEIVEIVNQEFQKILPDIEKDAETEAQKAISNHKTELENAVVDTSMKYTKQEEQELLDSINNSDKSILTEEQQKQLEDAITKDIETVIKEMQSDAQFQKMEEAVKEAVINVIKQNIGSITSNTLNNEINSMETQMNQMSDAQKASQLKQMLSSTDSQYITNLVTAETERLMKEQGLDVETAKSMATKEVYALLGDVSTKTMTTTLENVKSQGSTLSGKVVDETVKQVEQSTSTDEALKRAVGQYEQAIKTNIATKLGTTNQEIIKQVEDQMKQKVIDALKQELSKDQTLKQYESVARNELNTKIDKVANSTAQELASKYTETIANEVANNMIKNALSGELSNSEIDKELSKYENILNSTLNDVDSKVSTLKSALAQLTNGTEQLESGANTLADGMNQFNNEGISKIVDYINGDVKDLKERAEALKDLANKYNNFTGIDENTNGTVSFVIIVDNIKKDE